MLILLGVVFSAVVFRYVVQSPIPWSFEVSRYLNIWLVFLGMYYLEKDDEFLKVDYFISFLPTHFQKWLKLFTGILVIIVEFLLIFQGFIFVYKISGQKTAALRIPMWIAYVSCPIGMMFMSKISISKLIQYIKSFS